MSGRRADLDRRRRSKTKKKKTRNREIFKRNTTISFDE